MARGRGRARISSSTRPPPPHAHHPRRKKKNADAPSYDALASTAPSLVYDTDVIGSECAGTASVVRHERRSHTRTLSSKDPDASAFVAGQKATLSTKFVCPTSGLHASAPVATSHRRIVASSDALATCAPSGDHAMSLTPRK